MEKRQGNLSIDSENIFPIIKQWLYSDHDIFYRELISNGCDAITKLKKLDGLGEWQIPEGEELKVNVFVNQENGVCFVSDSSAAHENNIIEIGKKIGGNDRRHGLLYDVFVSGANGVFSTVFEDKYWVVANEHAYVWDFRLSTYENPSWFFFTNIYGVAFLSHAEVLYHLDAKAGVSDFRNNFSDYDQPIDKVYQFATQNMGTYDRLKNVMSVVFAVRSDTDTTTNIKYMTDYEDRYDLTPIRSMSWQLVPRNLAFRYLGVQRYAVVQRRRPECRHVRHFTMRLENNILGQDLSIISAQLQFNYQGRQM